MNIKPVLSIKITPLDKLIEILGWLSLVSLWILTIVKYSNLPETIPTHFNILGIADYFGNKPTIFVLPVVGTIVFIGLTILNNYPNRFRFLVKITEENALMQYTYATKLVRILKLSILLIFISIVLMISQSATGVADTLRSFRLTILFVLIFIPVIFFTVKSIKNSK